MTQQSTLLLFFMLFAVGCGPEESPASVESGDDIPSGSYAIDSSHTYVTFSYLHQGLSYPLLRAADVMGEIQYDAEDISNSTIGVTIAADSIRTNVENFDQELASRKFFNVEKYPYITFADTGFELTGDATGVLHGTVTIKGVTRPIDLAVTVNGAIIHPFLKVPTLGFSASGTLKRSDFGLDRFVPVVSDTVVVNIETEFLLGSTDASAAAAEIARNDAGSTSE